MTYEIPVSVYPEFVTIAAIGIGISMLLAVVAYLFRKLDTSFTDYEREKSKRIEQQLRADALNDLITSGRLTVEVKRKRKNEELITGDGDRLEIIHESDRTEQE